MEETIADRYKKIQERIAKAAIRSGRNPGEIRVVAVTKHQSLERIREAERSGIQVMSDNYVQDLLQKVLLFPHVEWHFTGKLQRNKVKYLVGAVKLIHSVDSKELAEELQKQGSKSNTVVPILIQVKLEDEPTKGGISEENLSELIMQISKMPHLELRGLMAQPPLYEAAEQSRPFFIKLRMILEKLQREFSSLALKELSMGTSHDFEVAVEEGATLVRIGTLLLGERVHARP